MNDLIGYAVAYKTTKGVVNFSDIQARPLREAEVLLAAKDIEYPVTAHFLVEIYPDSRATPETETADPRDEVTHV